MKQLIHLIEDNIDKAVLGKILLLVALASHVSTTANAMDPVYDFEGLSTGQSINGQDGWEQYNPAAWPGDIHIAAGTGVNTSSVATGVTANQSAATWRVNDAQFAFTIFEGTETNAIIEADMLVGTTFAAGVQFALRQDTNGTDPGGAADIGPQFGGAGVTTTVPNSFMIRAADAPQTSTQRTIATANNGASAGTMNDWYRLRFVIDFTANGGDGAGSLFYMNLTAGETAFTPITGLQNIDLKIVSSGKSPSDWNSMYMRVHDGSQIDNIKPSNATLPNVTVTDTTAPLISFRGKPKLKPGSRPTKVKGTATDDTAVGTLQFRASTGDKKTVPSGRMAHPFLFKFKNRKHKRRVRVSVTATDQAGNRRTARRVFR